MKEKLDKIIALLDSGGPEPEYLEVKSPIKEDPEGMLRLNGCIMMAQLK